MAASLHSCCKASLLRSTLGAGRHYMCEALSVSAKNAGSCSESLVQSNHVLVLVALASVAHKMKRPFSRRKRGRLHRCRRETDILRQRYTPFSVLTAAYIHQRCNLFLSKFRLTSSEPGSRINRTDDFQPPCVQCGLCIIRFASHETKTLKAEHVTSKTQ